MGSMGSQRMRNDWETNTTVTTFYWCRNRLWESCDMSQVTQKQDVAWLQPSSMVVGMLVYGIMVESGRLGAWRKWDRYLLTFDTLRR